MYCTHCGYELQQPSAFCPRCGTQLQNTTAPIMETTPAAVISNPAADHILKVLHDPMYLIICILLTAFCAVSLTNGSMPIIECLAAIFMWLVFAQRNKPTFSGKHIRNISGVVFANYVIADVLFSILFVVGCLGLIFGIFNDISSGMFSDTVSEEFPIVEDMLTQFGLSFSALLILACVILIVFSVVGFVLNTVGYRRIHRFLQSLYLSVNICRINFRYCRAAHIWLMVFGIFTALEAPGRGSVTTALCCLSSAAAMILGAVLTKKHFSQFE